VIIKRLIVGPVFQRAVKCVIKSLATDFGIALDDLAPPKAALMKSGCNTSRRRPCERIKNQITWICKAKHKPFDEAHGKLAWMICLFDMIALDVGNAPNVFRILSQGIARQLTRLRALEVSLSGIL